MGTRLKSSLMKTGVPNIPPTSVGKWQEVIFTEIGKNLDLLSLSMGNPLPNFRWEKRVSGNKFVPVVSVHPKARIVGPMLSFDGGVTAATNGTYRVEVMNSFGGFSLWVDLIVSSPPPRVELLPQKRTAVTGQNVDLNCRGETPDVANHAEITWFHNGKSLGLGGDDESGGAGARMRISSTRLSILNMRYEDQGVFQCFLQIGMHHVGASSNLLFPASEPELLHTFISQTLQPGPMVSLKCSAFGNPRPTITFYNDGDLVLSPTAEDDQGPWRKSSNHPYASGSYVHMNEIVSHVNISSIRVEDSGEWKCVASNLLSSAAHSARLNVYGRPFVKEMEPMTLSAGSVAIIPCKYGGYPIDKIVWRKNGSEIDTISRFRTLANGSLEIENIKPGAEQYSCSVSNRNGESASASVSVNILRPPVISSFNFDDNLQEGQRTSISCNVMSGDLPIDISWLKDSQPIPPTLNVTPMRVKFLSNLIFEELRGSHSGIYTCSASNAAATVNFSAHLVVKVPPSWSQEPMDSRALLKSDLMLPCLAIGMPRPNVQWFREFPMTRTAIRPDHKFQISENGSLLILGIETSSNLTCEATNGVGIGISKSIHVTVIVPAQISAPMTSVVVAEGLPVLLRCRVHGDGPVQVVWRKNAIGLEQSPRVLQTVLDTSSPLEFSAELRINFSEKSDSAQYHCIGFNQYGRDEDTISLLVKARPRPPKEPIVTEIGSRVIQLQLNWSLNSENDPVTHFVLQYKKSSEISWDTDQVSNITIHSPTTTAVLRSLNPVTNYEIRILAMNEIGQSLPTQPISVLTLPEAPSGPPLNVTAIHTSSRTILVQWEQPHPNLINGVILGYHVLVSPVPITSTLSNSSSKLIDEKWGYQTEVNELRPNSRYRISIRAYNSAGVGPESPFISVTTPEGAPESPPVNVMCEPLSPKSFQVMWEPPPPHLANGIIQGYKVIYSPAEYELQGEKPEIKKTGNRETTLHGLLSYTNYSVRTLAYTGGGESLPSHPVFCTTDEDLPEEPSLVKVLSSGPNSISVSWLPPRFPNGIITKYKIAWKSEDLETEKERYYMASGNEDQMLMEVRRLRDNKRYTFSVTAATSLGQGKPSESVDVVVMAKAPAKIASFPVTRRPKLGQSTTLPCLSVGFPNPEVTWLKSSGSSPYTTTKHVMRNGTLFIPRVKDQDEGTYFCTAHNTIGSDEIQHTISISRPPSSVSLVLGYITTNSIQVHWDSPISDPQLSGYILQYRSSSLTEWSFHPLGSRLTSFVLDNLLCGTAYQIRLAGENSIGMGEFSQMLRTKTTGSPPEQHPKLTEVIDGNGTMIRIDLNRWPNGGCRIKKFHLEFKNKNIGEWNTVQRTNFSRVFILNTTMGTKYDLRISLENEAGLVSKIFSVESSPEFFTNYEKLMQNNGDQSVVSGSALLSDPHIIVPIISACICTVAVIICIFIVVKRKTANGNGWKMGNSSSQQTWLSSDDFRIEKPLDKSKIEEAPGNSSGMSIYATLNSRQSMPMTIRDSTVRFQTFGQVENYDAPPLPHQPCFGRPRGNFSSSISHEELVMQEGFNAPGHNAHDSLNLQAIRNLRRVSNPNEYSVEDICSHDYAHPYQVVSVNRDPTTNLDVYDGRHTLRKQKQGKRSRGYPNQQD
ncbi:Down syndrome cell adhesion molecule-like protein Dscam2 isoform X2 [Folsomia candida]|uniref:Down syndrome cell adhesion molecule-like protein Dscam2 isoform X2 n=1 Tax=Folsomia candida TaxID=158441 RepID=UPI0016053386|nr:Down syndrome cell adhesion molecule-like protein Dscam2 isoform X2 [Folsomia candida]